MNDESMSKENETSEEWNLTFHGYVFIEFFCVSFRFDSTYSDLIHSSSYFINLISNELMLTLEVEDEETGDRWSGEFTSQCQSFLIVLII